nr:immunoglobulin heavy chain junction region [Mus musculus]MBK4197308.1 immunoglobulin heavy chain junction region [Mus musculus]
CARGEGLYYGRQYFDVW